MLRLTFSGNSQLLQLETAYCLVVRYVSRVRRVCSLTCGVKLRMAKCGDRGYATP